MAITLTEAAVKEAKKAIEAQQKKTQGPGGEGEPEKFYLRVGIIGGGCSGFEYDMTLTPTKNEHHEHFIQDGVEIICDPKSYIYMNGTTIDYVEGLMERGFRFQNPNASSTCGCGASFSA